MRHGGKRRVNAAHSGGADLEAKIEIGSAIGVFT
jgi:hypothetical protein